MPGHARRSAPACFPDEIRKYEGVICLRFAQGVRVVHADLAGRRCALPCTLWLVAHPVHKPMPHLLLLMLCTPVEYVYVRSPTIQYGSILK